MTSRDFEAREFLNMMHGTHLAFLRPEADLRTYFLLRARALKWPQVCVFGLAQNDTRTNYPYESVSVAISQIPELMIHIRRFFITESKHTARLTNTPLQKNCIK